MMSRPRVASVEAKLEIAALKKEIEELKEFKIRVELGQKWLLCAMYALGGFVAFVYTVIEIVKSLNIKIGS